jgi:hypothetical protein
MLCFGALIGVDERLLLEVAGQYFGYSSYLIAA